MYAGTDVFPSSFTTAASYAGAIFYLNCSTHFAKYRAPGCPIPDSPTAFLTGQSGGQLVSQTLTPGSSRILPICLLSRLLTLLVSHHQLFLLFLQLHCSKLRPALVPRTRCPLTRPSIPFGRRMETPSTELGIPCPVPLRKIPCALGLTPRRSRLSRLHFFVLFNILPLALLPCGSRCLSIASFLLILGTCISLS